MHTVDMLNAAIHHAHELGIQVREDWLDGTNGGECEIEGRRWIFLDLAQTPDERLAVMAECLASYGLDARMKLDPDLAAILQSRRAA